MFMFTEQEETFRQELRSWLEANLPKGWLTGKRSLPTDEKGYVQFLKDWQRKLYEGGWAAISWPKEYGGREATLTEEIIYHQEMVRVEAPPAINYVGTVMVGPTLMQFGTDQQKKRYIRKILTGEEIWCQGYSEPNAGSDLASLQTSAVKQGDKWIINGQKVWTSFAHVADRCFLLARTSTQEKKHQGITVFLLNMKQPGVETRPIIQMDGKHDFNEIYLTDAVAYDDEILGEVDNGWSIAMTLMLHERTGIGGQVFTLEKQFDRFLQMVRELTAEGRRLIEDPLVRQQLGDLYAKVRGASLNYYRHLLNTIKQGVPGPEGSMDKLLVSEITKELFSVAISLQGHHGLSCKEDAFVDSYWQDTFLYSFGMTIGGGTSEIQRNAIAERMLGLPKDMGR